MSHLRAILTAFAFADGGDSDSEALSCSGGRRDDGCFSVRFMWRTDGAGEMYTYLPPSFEANQAVCSVPPKSECNSVYGASVGRGSFSFTPGTRATIGQRVRLNDVGQENGELELFVEGKSIFTVKGLVYRNSDSGKIRGIQTFLGGRSSAVSARVIVRVLWRWALLLIHTSEWRNKSFMRHASGLRNNS